MLYVLQNNLLYFAVTNLDAATYQVIVQFTIAVIILRKKLMLTQWGALYFLISGISIIQLTDQKKVSIPNESEQNRLLGQSAALAACVMAGLAGVYVEKMLKCSDISVWMRNVQMSMIAVPLGIVTCLISDLNSIQTKGFFHEYDWFVVYLILFNAFGGILVGLVFKYADNILKGFATSVSIIISCIASVYLFDFQLTVQFAIGVMIVIGSICLYGHVPRPLKTDATNKQLNNMVDIEKDAKPFIQATNDTGAYI